jgi:CheY-like chemotaxis protein
MTVEILLVDDNLLIQQVIDRYLSSLGYRVIVAGSAAEALDYARHATPGLMIIDMHLPDKDGPEALDDLRALPSCANVPAIGMSGMDEAETAARRIGQFSEYLTKPVDLDVLETTVRKYLSPE